jgi:protein-tyrosine-phosphatase
VHAALGEPARLEIADMLALEDASPSEIGARLGFAPNLVSHHLKVLRRAGVIESSRSAGDRRRTYVHLRPEVLQWSGPGRLWTVVRVVFACAHNASRSQLASALWAHHSELPAASAGIWPANRVDPRAVAIAARHGVALRSRPARLDDVLREDDLLITVCDRTHEHLVGVVNRRLHWSVPPPADTDRAFEATFADLTDRVGRLAAALESSSTDC